MKAAACGERVSCERGAHAPPRRRVPVPAPRALCTAASGRGAARARSPLEAPRLQHATAGLAAATPARVAAPRAASLAARRGGRPPAAVLSEGGEAWWEHGSDLPNEVAVHSTTELLAALGGAGDRLVIVHFYAQWCGACKALHPKLVQIIKSREDVLFVKVDFDGNKAMCRTLGVKVLPFFHFYRGSSGRVAEFSASLSKIDRLRSALEQHGAARCPLGDSTPTLPAELMKP